MKNNTTRKQMELANPKILYFLNKDFALANLKIDCDVVTMHKQTLNNRDFFAEMFIKHLSEVSN